MGLAEIKLANRNPKKHAQSQLSDGQERRNNSPANAYWSERPVGADHSVPYHHQSENLAEMQIAPQVLTADGVRDNQMLFEGVLLANVVEKRIKTLQQQRDALAVAITLARADADEGNLVRLMQHIDRDDPSLAIEAHVETLARQIDVAAPEPHGYTPHMGIQYALAPIKATIQKMRAAFKHA